MAIAFDPDDFDRMAAQTARRIAEGATVLYEAAFKERGIFAMADILVKEADGWAFYEVKSSTSIKSYHLDDAAIQWYAISEVLPLKRACIVHIDNGYERRGELEIEKLFRVVDVTEEVMVCQAAIPGRLVALGMMLRGDEPDIDIGPHCFDPFVCDFYDYCWQKIPSPSVFNLYRLSGSKKFELYRQGIVRYEDVPDDYPLNPTQRLQIQTSLLGTPHVDKEVIERFLNKLHFPIHFFDFETFSEPVPRFDGLRPYRQVPFQYSLHILHEEGSLEHREFLADEREDPRKPLAERMLGDIGPEGSIVAFNLSFEIGRIRELAEALPEYREPLLVLTERFVDLIEPFRKLGYYHPDFHGSFSIKSVLPALFPDDPELSYQSLGRVHNGEEAMEMFANLPRLKDPNMREAIRQDLLDYCRLDTLAMVKIYEKLKEAAGL